LGHVRMPLNDAPTLATKSPTVAERANLKLTRIPTHLVRSDTALPTAGAIMADTDKDGGYVEVKGEGVTNGNGEEEVTVGRSES
jgi:hypothetical protein